MKNKYRIKDYCGRYAKWFNLHNAIAVSYYAYNTLCVLDKCLKEGVIPLPDEIENENLTEYGQND